jgi:hypothetical protein
MDSVLFIVTHIRKYQRTQSRILVELKLESLKEDKGVRIIFIPILEIRCEAK